MDDELIDDVFEDDPSKYFQNTDTGLNIAEATFLDEQTPSPTGVYPGFKPNNRESATDDDDGWRSYRIIDDTEFDENTLHKVKHHL